jgi:hypothetical protein
MHKIEQKPVARAGEHPALAFSLARPLQDYFAVEAGLTDRITTLLATLSIKLRARDAL